MHPETAKTLVAQHHDELVRDAASRSRRSRRSRRSLRSRRRFPRWHVSWTRTVLVPVGSAAANRAGQAGRRGSSLVIIISAHRSG